MTDGDITVGLILLICLAVIGCLLAREDDE